MERRLLNYIMNPALAMTWLTGFLLVVGLIGLENLHTTNWLMLKIVCVFLLTLFQLRLIKHHIDFSLGYYDYSTKYYRIINEVPTVLLLLILVLVIYKI